MKILHVIKNEKFTDPFIKFINMNFNSNEHRFLVYGNGKSYPIEKTDNILETRMSIKSLLHLIKDLHTSQKIIIHGLFSPYWVLLLFLQPWLIKKCYWAIWGGDLYYRIMRTRTVQSNINEYLRKFVIKRMGGFITHIKGDYELVKDWYGAKGNYYYSFMYPSNLFKEYSLKKEIKPLDIIHIQIGNSADPNNNHLEILNKLHRYKHLDIEIICPLSYGDQEYARRVVEYGNDKFSHKFVPITEFLSFDKYLDLLGKIDIAIFNHNRQQALGNIITLLGLGKKVYIRKEITTWQFCIDHDLKVYCANDEFDKIFVDMPMAVKKNNIERIKTQFSEEKLANDWAAIFRGGAQ